MGGDRRTPARLVRVGRAAVFLSAAALVAGILIATPLSVQPVAAAGRTFTVNSTGDAGDTNEGDGACNAGGGQCTLRAAIEEANASAGHDTIEFDIAGAGPHTIRPGGDGLEWITSPDGVTIDGYSQPGSRANTAAHGTNAIIKVQIEGQGTDDSKPDGLELRSRGNVVRGLAIYDFRLQVRMVGGSSTDNVVVGNFLGTNAAATFVNNSGNSSDGVHIQQGAKRNLIGTSSLADRNLISGNAGKGVAIYDVSTDNLVRNNVIGLAPNGTSRLPNRSHGVDINVGASRNLIGGSGAREGNVISGNGFFGNPEIVGGEGSGIEISHDRSSGIKTTGNQFIGNLIGTTADGSAGTSATRNAEFGINFEGNEGCRPVDAQCPDDIAFNSAIDNVIVGSEINVILWKGANQNVIRGNRIGVLGNGARPASAGVASLGILLEVAANRNVIERNTIAYVPRGVLMRAGDPADGFNGSFPVYGNRLSRNSIYAIDGGLGIDLIGPGDTQTGPSSNPGGRVQGGIGYPTIDSVSSDRLVGRTCANCSVEVFVTPRVTCSNCDAAFGRGKTWVADGTADSSGRVTIVFRSSSGDPFVVRAGQRVSMHATDRSGNTSEFSRSVVATAGAAGGVDPGGPIDPGGPVDSRYEPASRCNFSPVC